MTAAQVKRKRKQMKVDPRYRDILKSQSARKAWLEAKKRK